jgi:hypothetical protein
MKPALFSHKATSLFAISLIFFCVQPGYSLTWAYDTYSGTGVDATAITGLSFQPSLVIIKGTGSTPAFIRTSTLTGSDSKELDATGAYAADAIESIAPTGFTIGTNAGVNASGSTYDFVAFAAGTDMVTGTYTGGGALTQSIAGLSFTPDFVLVYSNSGTYLPAYMTTEMSGVGSVFFGEPALWLGYILTLDANGFTVGEYLCEAGQVYHYVAFKAVAGVISTGSYAGSAADLNVPTPGMNPEYVISTTASVFGLPVQKMPTNAATESMRFTGAAATSIDITALNTGTFTVKAGSPDANATTDANYYIAFGGGIAFPLPIRLTAFNVACVNEKVKVTWTTSSEVNNALFTVERTTDGIHFETAGTLPGAGNSSVIRNYVLTLESGGEQTTYYRLKQTDYDGQNTYSSLAILYSCQSSDNLSFNIFPNPAQTNLNVSFTLKKNTAVLIAIYDAAGKLICSRELNGIQGSNLEEFDLDSCSSGLYCVRVSGDDLLRESRFLKN